MSFASPLFALCISLFFFNFSSLNLAKAETSSLRYFASNPSATSRDQAEMAVRELAQWLDLDAEIRSENLASEIVFF